MIVKVALTGGPGTGKTTVKQDVVNYFTPLGYIVLCVPETATDFINGGIKCFGDDPLPIVYFQECVMKMQLYKEKMYDRIAKKYEEMGYNVIVLLDRGTVDNFAYMNKDQSLEFNQKLGKKVDFYNLVNKYDLVIGLLGKKEFYTLENNPARSEDADKALLLGTNTLEAWLGYENIKIVGPKDEMFEKSNEVINYVKEILNKRIKKQKKYLVNLQNCNFECINNGKMAFIEQYYLQSEADEEKRIRKVCLGDSVSYYFSYFKYDEEGNKVIVSEDVVDKKMFNCLLGFLDKRCEVIKKKRYYFNYGEKSMYLDVYGDNEIGILEVNMGLDEKVVLPEFLDILEDVTGKNEFTNHNMALAGSQKYKKVHD